MKKELRQKLFERGWEKEEVNRVDIAFKKAHKKKSKFIRLLDATVYWIALILFIATNVAVSFKILPLLWALRGIYLYSLIGVIAFAFGLFFDVLLRSMEHIEKKHHLLAIISIPLLAVINLTIITRYANVIVDLMGIPNEHNPFLIGVVYAIAFILPYLLSAIRK